MTSNSNLRGILLERDGNRCHYCNCVLSFILFTSGKCLPYSATIEHIVPRYMIKHTKYHGNNDQKLDNFALTCSDCNNKKGEFLHYHDGCDFCASAIAKYKPAFDVVPAQNNGHSGFKKQKRKFMAASGNSVISQSWADEYFAQMEKHTTNVSCV